jgi:uncharacterized membrane protein YsdA (DUF1294 family)
MKTFLLLYLIVVLLVSTITFLAYGWDKRQAGSSSRRIRERTLHLLAVLGGWPGALVGQRHFRHKTRKVPFLVAFWLTVILHFTLVGFIVYFLNNSATSGG